MEAHLLDVDIPFEHRGMRGRMWRAQLSANRAKAKLQARRAARQKGPAADATAEGEG
jgi:hypothetical protein